MTGCDLSDLLGASADTGAWSERVVAGAAVRFRFASLGVPAGDRSPLSETGLQGFTAFASIPPYVP
jgi:hypothetical protein